MNSDTNSRTPTDLTTATTTDEQAAFLVDLMGEDLSAHTVRNYQLDLADFAQWFTGTVGKPFAAVEVTPTDVREYKAHLVAVGKKAPATVNRRLAALRKFFLWARGKRLVTELPTDLVKGVTAAPRAPKSLEKREVDRLIRMAERRGRKRDVAILKTLRHTGLRVSELCALRLGDVDITERKGSLTVWGKGQRQRTIPLNVDARQALGQYLAVRPRVGDDHLFLSQRGGRPLGTHGVEQLVATYARQAGLEDVTPHTLRHSFGKHLLDAGEALPTVAAALGHANLNTTAIYTQPSARDLERAVERLEWERTER